MTKQRILDMSAQPRLWDIFKFGCVQFVLVLSGVFYGEGAIIGASINLVIGLPIWLLLFDSATRGNRTCFVLIAAWLWLSALVSWLLVIEVFMFGTPLKAVAYVYDELFSIIALVIMHNAEFKRTLRILQNRQLVTDIRPDFSDQHLLTGGPEQAASLGVHPGT